MVEKDNTAVTPESINEAVLFLEDKIGSSDLNQEDKKYLLDRYHAAAARVRMEFEND